MQPLSHADCLALWERGHRSTNLDRALKMLGAAMPETPPDILADWPLGERNRALANLHIHLIGPSLDGWLSCPDCGEKLTFALDLRVLATEPPCRDRNIIFKDWVIRLPSTRDLAAACRNHAPEEHLLTLCLLSPPPPAWHDDDVNAIGEKMLQADPAAEIRLAFNCPECSHLWQETLDIAAFLWAEIDARARRLIADIHVLACAYGWAEADIIAMSEQRRTSYLRLVQS